MERVKKGEKYWYFNSLGEVVFAIEYDIINNILRFEVGNYFITEEQAEDMARKIRAVLKGADAIEMPSEEDMQTLETKDIVLAEFLKESHEDLDMIMHGRHAYWRGWNACFNWLKSKIVK